VFTVVKLTEKIQPRVKLGFEMETIVGMETDHEINEVDKLGYGPLINGMRAISKHRGEVSTSPLKGQMHIICDVNIQSDIYFFSFFWKQCAIIF
jgi:hypothetical protein